jgi:hypothetical protein
MVPQPATSQISISTTAWHLDLPFHTGYRTPRSLDTDDFQIDNKYSNLTLRRKIFGIQGGLKKWPAFEMDISGEQLGRSRWKNNQMKVHSIGRMQEWRNFFNLISKNLSWKVIGKSRRAKSETPWFRRNRASEPWTWPTKSRWKDRELPRPWPRNSSCAVLSPRT